MLSEFLRFLFVNVDLLCKYSLVHEKVAFTTFPADTVNGSGQVHVVIPLTSVNSSYISCILSNVSIQ